MKRNPAPTMVSVGGNRQLSSAQRTLLASQLAHPDEPVQNMALVTHLDGVVDPVRLAGAFADVVAANDVLRTTIQGTDGAVTLAPADKLPRTEVLQLDRHEVEAWAEDRCSTPLDLSACGWDSALAVHPDGTASWYLNLHHVLTDATSSSLVFQATAAAYEGNGTTESRSYYRWATNEADAASPAKKRALEFWRQREAAPKVGYLYKAPSRPTARANRLPLTPSADLLGKVQSRLDADYRMLTEHLGWSTLLLTTTALFLHRVTGAAEFALGLPVHNRTTPEERELIGPLMEVFPVDVEIHPDDTGKTLHKRLSRSVLKTLQNAVAGTAPAADYEVVVNVIPQVEQAGFGAIPARTKWIHAGAIDGTHLARVQMTAYDPPAVGSAAGPEAAAPRLESNGDLASSWEFALDLAEGGAGPDHIERCRAHFLSVLEYLVEDPQRPIGSWDLLGEAEREQIETWADGPDLVGPDSGPVAALKAALETNDSTVLEDGADFYSGRELWAWVQSTSRWLQGRGIGPGDRVGIDLGRSAETVVAILATLVSGGSFVPLDPAQPSARRRRLAQLADCRLVIDRPDTISELRPEGSSTIPARPFDPPPDDPDAEAYVIFTSGSTGEPKGVPISRSGLFRYLQFATDRYTGGRRPSLVAPLFSPLTFDLTITTLFVPFLANGRLIVVGDDGPRGLAEIAQRREITWCKATPAHLEILVRLLPPDHRLSTIIVGGEAFPSRLAVDLLAGNPEREIHNEYGPTEAVVGCMDYLVERATISQQSDVPIGGPAPGVRLAVVDRYLQPVPIGSPGELLISSPGVTAGYLRSDSSASSDSSGPSDSPFIEKDDRRWYRSGDLVRLQDPERLVYLGRLDEQVKVGGIRLEPTEVEAAISSHPDIDRAAVRLWSPSADNPRAHCIRCGLPDNIPGVAFDDNGVCETCHAYNKVAPIAASWFRTSEDLGPVLQRARSRATGDYDCLHLLSGGKDSTFALYKLVELGFKPYSLTLDNGFISEEAKANVARSVADLGIDHDFITVDAMNEIFRDSLERHSNVCHGCYKTIYTVAVNKATEKGIPLIVTGLSRGQLFETRLIPQQFSADRFDPDAIDRAVLEARKIYHRADDLTNRLLDTGVFDSDEVFERIEYLDFYRYVDVELADMLRFLDERAPWVRPKDTGRSTNCLINAAGIHTHKTEQGYHNYAEPYAWDVRLGHKTRDEAIDELDDRLDMTEVSEMLAQVGYAPRPRRFLTAWIVPRSGTSAPPPSEIRAFLGQTLPTHAIPSAFVQVETLPMSANGKLAVSQLPGPTRIHRQGPTLGAPATTATEAAVVEVWEKTLGIEPISVDDDFFALGGDSLGALQMTVTLGERLGLRLGDDMAFLHSTPRSLAEALDQMTQRSDFLPDPDPQTFATGADVGPERSDGELAVLFDQTQQPDSVMYNVARVYRITGTIDVEGFTAALREIAATHQPLSWSYGSPRRRLDATEAVSIDIASTPVGEDELISSISDLHQRRFDLENGPLLRCRIQSLDSGDTAVVFVIHHASGDAASFDRLWNQLDQRLGGNSIETLPIDYAGFAAWQRARRLGPPGEAAKSYWLEQVDPDRTVASLEIQPPTTPRADGFLTQPSSVSPALLRAGSKTSTAASVVGALAAVLGSYHDGDDLEIGLITSTRDHQAAANLFGYFLNTVPLRLPLDSKTRPLQLRTLADLAASAIGGALAHRSYPRAQIALDRRLAGHSEPKLDVYFSYDELPELRFGGAPVHQRVLWNGSAVATLTFFAEVRDGQIELSVEYRGDRVPTRVAQDILEAWDAALARTAHQPESTCSETTSSALAARGSLALLNGADPGHHRLVSDRIGDHFSRADADETKAVECDGETLTWAELNVRSRQLADHLIASGLVRGDRVAVILPRSVESVVALAAVGRAGGSYVPVDPNHPVERQVQATQLAKARFALVGSGVGHDGSSAEEIEVSALGIANIPWRAVGSGPVESLSPEPNGLFADDEAYVIFTSGSTGVPRGVPVTAGRLAISTGVRSLVYPAAPRRFLMPSSPAFDSSIVGLFWTLAEGGTVVLPSDTQVRDVDSLVGLTAACDHVLMVPTLYRALLDRHPVVARSLDDGLDGTGHWPRQVIVAGEACPPALVQEHFARHPDSRLTNEYGPTEATVWATSHHCSPADDPVPLGHPIPGTSIAVIDASERIRPVGVAGQLAISGSGLVDGYLDDAEATDHAFGMVEHPEVGPTRAFLSGDRVVLSAPSDSATATLQFMGRTDHRLTLGGLRVEPEEVEQAVLAAESVTAAVVVAVDLRTRDQLLAELDPKSVSKAMERAAASENPAEALTGELQREGRPDLRLVAHVEGPDSVSEAALRQAVRQLPSALRPSRFVVHRRLPRTPNGKLDRKAAAMLATPPAEAVQSADRPRPAWSTSDSTRADLVQMLSSAFADVLRVKDFHPDESFFEHGGHSLLAMELVLKIEETTGTEVAPTQLYDNPTPRGLAGVLEVDVDKPSGGRTSGASRGMLVPIQPNGSQPPIFAVHVLGVDSAYFRPLAAELGEDQPLFGLGQPLLDSQLDTSIPTAVADVARSYADEIDLVHPQGPLSLAAISLGAVVAWELAQQLHERGRTVELMTLFDALGPDNILLDLDARSRLTAHASRALKHPGRYIGEQLDRQRQKAQRQTEQLALAFRRRLGMKAGHRLEVRRFIEANLQAQFAYDFKPYSGRLLVIKAADDPMTPRHLETSLGWQNLAIGDLQITVAPGGHLTMMDAPNVTTVAEAISTALAPARTGLSNSASMQPAPTSLEQDLIESIHAGNLPATVRRRIRTSDDYASSDAALLNDLDRLMTSFADAAAETATTVVDALEQAGVKASAVPLPSQMSRLLSLVGLDETSVSRSIDNVEAILRVLADFNHRPVLSGSSDDLAKSATSDGALDFVNDSGSRIQLRWADSQTTSGRPEESSAQQNLGIFLGTPNGLIGPLLDLAELKPGQNLIDLGSGDGRVLIEAARVLGVRGRGYESDPDLVAVAKANVEAAGVADLVEVVHADARAAELESADVVFAFLPPQSVAEILPTALRRMSSGSRFLCHEQLPDDVIPPAELTRLVMSPPAEEPSVAGITVARIWVAPG